MAYHLVIFARFPQVGVCKRRLSRSIGTVEATRFQRATLAKIARRLAHDPRWKTWLAITPDRSGPWPADIPTIKQGSGDLGQRMQRVIHALPPGLVVIVGTDIPQLSASHIAEAFHLLGNCDFVIGPAVDGGYWLIGFRQNSRRINPFSNVRWSTENTLSDTRRNLKGHTVGTLETLEDVDDGPSFARYRQKERTHVSGRT